MNRAEILTAMSRQTGLSRNTIKDLMKNGWYYQEADGKATFSKAVKK